MIANFGGTYTNRTCVFASPSGQCKVVGMVTVCSCNFYYKFIYWIQGNFGREGLVVKVWFFKKVFIIRYEPMGTKVHWVNH